MKTHFPGRISSQGPEKRRNSETFEGFGSKWLEELDVGAKMKPESEGQKVTCETPGCDKEAKLQCPTCIKLRVQVGSSCSWNRNSVVGIVFGRPSRGRP